jgi:hypothetical protein
MDDTPAIEELKTRARLLRNASTRSGDAELKLGDALHDVARSAGFLHWEHARRVLGGLAVPGDDMGTFWHEEACGAYLNNWIAGIEPARQAFAALPGAFLVPYRRQFVVVEDGYIRALGLDPADPAWAALRRDLVGGYGSPAWRELCRLRLQASRTDRAARR